MEHIPAARWPGWSWLAGLSWLRHLRTGRAEGEGQCAVQAQSPASAPPRAGSAAGLSAATGGDIPLERAVRSMAKERALLRAADFSEEEWQRLVFLRWRYRQGHLDERTRAE